MWPQDSYQNLVACRLETLLCNKAYEEQERNLIVIV